MTRTMPDRYRERPQGASTVPRLSLRDVCARTGLSPRWVRELIKRHELPVRRIPCPGRYRFLFSPYDVEQIERIHAANQERLECYPAFYAVVGKRHRVPQRAVRSPWSLV